METNVSIVIAAHDNARELRRYLPAILAQDYDADFQIIVVAEKGDTDSEDVLQHFAANDSRLYYTAIPESSRYMSRKKLQITLGVKAAKYEWILLIDADSLPQGNLWLKTMAENCSDNVNLVMGYVSLDETTASFRRFEHIYNTLYLFQAARKIAWRTNNAHLMFRKSDFIRQDGYRGNLHMLRGEYDFIVNKYAEKGRTAVEIRPQAWLIEEKPTHKEWHNRHIHYQAIRKELRYSQIPRFLYSARQLLLHFFLWVMLVAIAYFCWLEDWWSLGISGCILLFAYLGRAWTLKSYIHEYDQLLPTLILPFYEFCIAWSNLYYFMKYKRTAKTDFTSHHL